LFDDEHIELFTPGEPLESAILARTAWIMFDGHL
jgi:hypothetical protein